jgi:hypothetical protein
MIGQFFFGIGFTKTLNISAFLKRTGKSFEMLLVLG